MARRTKHFFFLGLLAFWMQTDLLGEPLKVGVLPGPPFVIKHNKTTYSGIAIEIWDAIAQGLNQDYSFVEFSWDKTDEALESLKRGEIEAIIGPLSVTQDGLAKADFTIPYFIDKVIVISTYNYVYEVIHFMKMLFISIAGIISIFFLVLILYLHFLWYFERHFSPKIPKGYREGISYLFWIHVLTGQHSNVPRSVPGKFLLLFKTGSFYIILITLNATLISFMTVSLSRWGDPIQNLADLEKRRVGATIHRNSIKVGTELGLKVLPFGSLTEGIQALEGGQIGAFLAELSLADSYLKGKGKADLEISHFELSQTLYAIATPINSQLLRKINIEMMKLRKNEIPMKICKRYLSKGVKNCEL